MSRILGIDFKSIYISFDNGGYYPLELIVSE